MNPDPQRKRETMNSTETQPRLDAPGAGLPRTELFVSRVGFRLLSVFLSRRMANRWFQAEADQILALARSLPPDHAARRVLIPRLPGLEDSSRYWSVYMTLEHLCIVDSEIARVTETLAAGHTVPDVVSTAAVKPSDTADASNVARFEQISRDYLTRLEAVKDSRSRLTLKHPWFGELGVSDWHRLGALHHRIHRKQIECIMQLLPGPSA
jgi:hypothetical protein